MGSKDCVWLNVASKQGMKPAIICRFKSLICWKGLWIWALWISCSDDVLKAAWENRINVSNTKFVTLRVRSLLQRMVLLLVEFPRRKRMFFHALCNFMGFKWVSKRLLQFFFLQKICWLQRFRIVFCQFSNLGFFFFSKSSFWVLWGVLELKNPFPSISCFRNWTHVDCSVGEIAFGVRINLKIKGKKYEGKSWLNDNGFTHLQLTFQVQFFVFFLCLFMCFVDIMYHISYDW